MDEDSRSDLVGVVGDDGTVVQTVRDVGRPSVAGTAATVLEADPALVIAVGESALCEIARQRPDAPLLPVAAGPCVASIPPEAVPAALDRQADGDAIQQAHPLLAVDVRGERVGLACLDAAIQAAEPGRISAFAVAAGDDHLGSVRADGVVVATPAGTHGYAARLDAPAVSPGTDVLVVEPIAQFATTPDRWVCPDASVAVTVERDAVPVEVLADDRAVAEASVGDAVSVARAGRFETLEVPGLSAARARRGAELEKH